MRSRAEMHRGVRRPVRSEVGRVDGLKVRSGSGSQNRDSTAVSHLQQPSPRFACSEGSGLEAFRLVGQGTMKICFVYGSFALSPGL